uniref:Methyl-CpG binding domain protein 1b n=2 Tax=Cyprinus carpio TaxID=7962 RepID=A0A8C1EEP5_CYPCA
KKNDENKRFVLLFQLLTSVYVNKVICNQKLKKKSYRAILLNLLERTKTYTNMETEEVAAEAHAEPVTEVKDANTEESKEPTESTDTQNHVTGENKEGAVTEKEGESSKDADKPPCDWLEPLEEDCDDVDSQSVDGEVESLVGSEWSGSVVSVRKSTGERGGRGVGRPRRRAQCEVDEDWEDWPSLGQGWKRKQVFRRSGTSEGRSDTYYMSPRGHKVRSRVELVKYISQSVDLTNFDFKTGQFLGEEPRRRKVRRCSAYPGGATSNPGSSASLSYSTAPKLSSNSIQKSANTVTTPKCSTYTSPETNTALPSATAQLTVDLTEDSVNPTPPPLGGSVSLAPDRPINGASGNPQKCFGVCLRCHKTYNFEEGQTMCQNCRLEGNTCKSKCMDCGKCVSCRNGRLRLRLNIHSRKVAKCRKRKCLRPIHKDRTVKSPSSFIFQPSVSDDFEESQSSYLQYSDSEDLSMFFGGNDGDSGLDEMGIPKVRRRSCGKCKGCVRRTDCGSCDFCMDKPKFGGRNKKRQKCRLRQCQREAMKHLLPMDEAEMLFSQGWVTHGRPRYTYGRGRPRSKKLWDFEVSDNEAESYVQKAHTSGVAQVLNRNRLYHPSYNRKAYVYTDVAHSHMMNNIPLYNPHKFMKMSPQLHIGRPEMIKENGLQGSAISSRALLSAVSSLCLSITQIFSMADNDPTIQGIDINHELMPLLRSLRSMVLPVLWFCVVVEGPQLQLMQCSKRSTMADTIIHIEPNFHYHISVQGQPLLPTHRLYNSHPSRLTTTKEIVALLEDLEMYSVCQGSGHKKSTTGSEPVVPERAATCDFLVFSETERCEKCKTLQKV